jgi:hypothetical protein
MRSSKTMPRSWKLWRFRALSCLLLFSAALMLLPALMTGCRKSQKSAGIVTWDGAALSLEREVINPSDSMLRGEGYPTALKPLPHRFLALRSESLQDEIKLLEFAKDIEAYAAFQRLADPVELTDGFAVRRDRVFFRKGCWLGALSASGTGRERLQARLQLPGDGEWGALPGFFPSLLHQDRIPHSERIILDRFLGIRTPLPVFTAGINCHGDTAWIYAALGMPADFALKMTDRPGYRKYSSGKETLIIVDSGWDHPLRLVFFEEGMVGAGGCFDTSLTNPWIITQEKVLKSIKIQKKL